MKLIFKKYQNIITAHAQSIHIRIEFTRRKTFKRTDSHGVYIFSWVVIKARKGKVLVPTARTVVLRPGRKHGYLGWLRSFSPSFTSLNVNFLSGLRLSVGMGPGPTRSKISVDFA